MMDAFYSFGNDLACSVRNNPIETPCFQLKPCFSIFCDSTLLFRFIFGCRLYLMKYLQATCFCRDRPVSALHS